MDAPNTNAIPADIFEAFLGQLNGTNTTTKRYYDVEPATQQKVLTRVVEEERPNDMKAVVSLFQAVYPQYFDPLNNARLEKLQKDTGTQGLDEFKRAAREMLEVKD